MNKRLIRLDSSSLEHWNCPRKFQFVNRLGLIPKLGSAPLDWGQALHRGIALWSRGNMPSEAIDDALEHYNKKMCVKIPPRTPHNLQVCLQEYFEEYANDQWVPLNAGDGKLAVELPFALPLLATETTDVLLCGTIDSVVMNRDTSQLAFKDIKHSSTTKPDSHLEEQLGRPQFHIYTWALHHEGLRRPDGGYLPVIVDAVYIDKKYDGARFRRTAPTILEDWVVERTMEYVRSVARILAELPDEELWPHNYNACHGKYSKCDFVNVCQLPKGQQPIVIDMMFGKRDYNPATFGD